MQTENSIAIKGSLEEVFSVMADVESWPLYLSSHRDMRILRKEEDMIEIERKGIIKWISVIEIDRENIQIKSDQIKGPVKGLKALWRFEELKGETKMVLEHSYHCQVSVIGWIIELIVAFALKKISNNTLKAVKERVEQG
ncbi:MAG: SRPBCC family protein [bacterium]|nr:SRPBCC family protein [bacterium]